MTMARARWFKNHVGDTCAQGWCWPSLGVTLGKYMDILGSITGLWPNGRPCRMKEYSGLQTALGHADGLRLARQESPRVSSALPRHGAESLILESHGQQLLKNERTVDDV